MAWPIVAAGPTVLAAAGASTGFAGAATAADCCGDAAGCCEESGLVGAGFGIGTVWLATRGIEAGGRGPPRITVGAGSALCGP